MADLVPVVLPDITHLYTASFFGHGENLCVVPRVCTCARDELSRRKRVRKGQGPAELRLSLCLPVYGAAATEIQGSRLEVHAVLLLSHSESCKTKPESSLGM